MSARNRRAGNGFELKVLKDIKDYFPDAVTSRNESRSIDAKKVDFCNTGKLNFQCKLSINTPGYKILDEMPDEGINVIIHGKCQKANKNFVLKDEYVIMKYKDFLKGALC